MPRSAYLPWLHRRVHAAAEVSPGSLIRRRRLERAERLMLEQGLTAMEVIYEVGWSNLSYLAQVFRAQFGVVSSAYVRTA